MPNRTTYICERAEECDNKSCSCRIQHLLKPGCESGCIYLGKDRECSCK